MPVDENKFFRDVTLRICGNLDIGTAMESCREYISNIMPVDGMSLHLYSPDFLTVRTIAHVTRDPAAVKFDKIAHLSKKVRDSAHRWTNWLLDTVTIFGRNDSDPMAKAMTQFIKQPDSSSLVLRLRVEIEGNRLGILAIYAAGEGRYTEEHVRYLSLLHDPFAIAMSNAIKHEAVINLKDQLKDDIQYLSRELVQVTGGEVIGKDGGLKDVMRMVHQVAAIDSPVLLLGETGVGKEVIANLIHDTSSRKGGPFIKINCGAIPETLVDSELFGHEKGAFTGAFAQKRGRFERAHKGSILLDEIGELPLSAQVRLLRILQTKEVERVGGTVPVPVDVRIMSATHRNLEDMVEKGKFREDLWFRLNVFPIVIPPLRHRKEDIPALAHYLIERKSKELKIKAFQPFLPRDLERLKEYQWPGNVRELANVVERALIQNRGEKDNHLMQGPFADQQRLGGAKAPSGHKTKIKKSDESTALNPRERGCDNRYCRYLIIDLIGKRQPVSREEINRLLLDKLPDVLSEEQKIDKIHNLISSLTGRVIHNIGSRRSPQWLLINNKKSGV